MKKNQLVKIASALLFCIITIATTTQAADNYLYFRVESGEKVAESEEYGGTYTVLENNSIEGLSLGSKIITGNNGFNKLNPYVFKHLFSGWQIGAKYSEDSFQNQTFGPAIRFKGKAWKLFVIFDYVRDFGVNQQTPAKNEMWFYLSTTNPDFNIGSEIWYYNFLNGSKYLHLRPIRMSYKYQSMNFFIMPNFCLQDEKLMSRSLMSGIEIKF